MSIFDHVSLRTTRLEETRRFYEAALAALGIDRRFYVERAEGSVAGFGRDRVELFLTEVQGTEPAPVHVAFRAGSREEVQAFHAAGLIAGGIDNGAPGVRARYHDRYYAAFVIDPAGNNVEAVFQGPE
ncbi:VOC family protein [Rhodobacter sphaeroides]|uniref:VOC family protein n=1 Tax=Cereibacter sphaeroides TaxID=1063 RepID=UPI0013244A4C|nr:VOC family protein [Cereibacter sphaeroides]MWP36000.1 VOC family protein [Cereibacter sphaeroides]